MRRLCAIALAAILGAIAACSSFSSSPSPDAGSDATDAKDDASSSLVANGDFERGCGGWSTGSSASVTATTELVHGGTSACIVCGLDGGSPYFLFGKATMPVAQGTKFYGEAYLRTAPGKPAPATFDLRIDVVDGDGGTHTGTSATTTLADTFRQTTAFGEATIPDGVSVQLTLRATDTTSCFVVDDALLTLTK
jgi:hypothetical protein